MAIGLVLGGGAPNLTLMTGALFALDEAGVKFKVITTTGLAGKSLSFLTTPQKKTACYNSLLPLGVSRISIFRQNEPMEHRFG